jgi:hypothetical protein
VKYLQTEALLGDNECSEDAAVSTQRVELHLQELQERLDALGSEATLDERLHLTLDQGYALLELNRFDEAWEIGRKTLDDAIEGELWLRAVESCDIMFQSEKAESIQALAHGIWLGVTFPVDPELSVAMLQHMVDESPDRSDGAAVAAAVANYIVDLRAEGKQREELQFFTAQLLGDVARRHSQVEEQDIFDFWVQQLELDDPAKFLPRLAKVLDVLTDGNWWFDRDQLRSRIPG